MKNKSIILIIILMGVFFFISCTTTPVCITSSTTPLKNRVIATNLGPVEGGLDQAALRDAILDERAREFYMEGHRRLDLIRSGKYAEKWKANLERKYPGESFDYVANKVYFPVPQKEIDANDQIGE